MQLQLISIIGGLLQRSHAIAGSALLIQPVILSAPSNATKQKWLSPIRPTPDSKRKMRVGNCNVAGLPATQTLEINMSDMLLSSLIINGDYEGNLEEIIELRPIPSAVN